MKNRINGIPVTYVALNKGVPGGISNVIQVLQVSGIGKSIHINDTNISIFTQQIMDEIGSDEPGTAGH
jgi:hypothetical protein